MPPLRYDMLKEPVGFDTSINVLWMKLICYALDTLTPRNVPGRTFSTNRITQEVANLISEITGDLCSTNTTLNAVKSYVARGLTTLAIDGIVQERTVNGRVEFFYKFRDCDQVQQLLLLIREELKPCGHFELYCGNTLQAFAYEYSEKKRCLSTSLDSMYEQKARTALTAAQR